MRICIFALLAAGLAHAQQTKSFVGTVAGVTLGADAVMELDVKPDGGEPLKLKLTANTLAQRIAPGDNTLKNAVPASVGDLAAGDRVLITMDSGTTGSLSEVRRVVIMSSADIGKRDQADREDWNKRGISGVVASKQGGTIVLRSRTMQGEVRETVAVSDKTKFRRYAPDSTKFADTKPSQLAEIAVGDQVRARGDKSADGLAVAAEEVVFGTFLTTAGNIVSVDPTAQEVTITEMGSGKTVTIRITPGSRIKAMPNLGAPGGPGGGAAAGRGPGPGAFPAGGAFPGPPGGVPGLPGAPGLPGGNAPPAGAPTVAQMVEMMPPSTLADLKPGQTIVVSSTRGASTERLTAITLVANAEMLIRAAQPEGRGAAAQNGGPGGGFPRGAQGMDLGGLLGGFGLPGIGP
ncbi:MAG TPA: hypothetical protein VIY49_36935 [Bryobacteraceae bacterium]